MWRITPLFMLRKMFFSKGRAVSNSSTKDFPEKQHSGPMSDQQLAVAIRQFQRSRSKNDDPLTLRSTYRVGKQDT
jgi:hypothetical protein